jgi:hypothetical protein
MPLSLNEIRERAVAFSKEWVNETNEDAEAKSFWDGFFNIFGIHRRRVATFEQLVNKQDNRQGYIDLLWKGVMLIEHKSRGHDLDRAYQQAKDYFPGIKENELPRYILVCDFARFRLYDLEDGWQREFKLNKLVEHIHLFDFLSGYKRHVFKEQDPVNIKAAQLMGRLHDQLKEIGYTGHDLEVYLVRLLFCLFADDTNIFEKGIFQEYIERDTARDGSDLATRLTGLFDVLDQPKSKRLKNLSETLNAFPHVNGKLYEERLPMASFDTKMRQILLDCCYLDWSKISPAIFGSLFQSVMDNKARRNLGAHYTSEKNIMKVIKPLFVDELWAEFNKLKNDNKPVDGFHRKLSELRFLDPACGCGNFLIIAYRELRLLEIEVLKVKFKNQIATNIEHYINVNVDQFYGIEYEEFPAQIAQVAMWLIDHQMNQLVSETFGEYYARLPLVKSAKVTHGNALRIDWQSLIEKMPWDKETPRFNYIMGNPPFIGHQWRNDEQKKDMDIIWLKMDRSGRLDYVTCWFKKAVDYMVDNSTKTAFVSTNSITQGEQPAILWREINKKGIVKNFAYRTFIWSNEAYGEAHVHVVIICFSKINSSPKLIYEESRDGKIIEYEAKNINGYLIDANDIILESRGKPLWSNLIMFKGSQPTDGGNLILSPEQKSELGEKEKLAEKWIKEYIGSEEFLNGGKRYCLWLKNISPNEIKKMPEVYKRVEKVSIFRLQSPTLSVREFSKYPTLFTQDRQPNATYLVIPEVSSINRQYIPMGFLTSDIICSNKLQIIPHATIYLYGLLQSVMHMSWTKCIGGRLKSDYSYSPSVYNNFPWPETPLDKNIKAVEIAAQLVLDVRAQFPDSSLAVLYDPNTMPPVLVKAHQILDKAVDLCYRPQPFPSEAKRIEFLFELYDKYTAGLFAGAERKKRKNK